MLLRFERVSRSAGNKKWVSATPVADFGDSQALWIPPRVPWPLGIAICNAALQNRAGATVRCGIAGRYPIGIWTAGQVTAAGAFTADTTDAQDADAGDFELHNRADSGSGFLVSCDRPFNILGICQSVAGDQVAPVLIVEYWNGAAWVDIVTAAFIADALNGGVVPRENVICWPQPSDWAPGGSGAGVPAGKFNLRVRQTHGGAGTTNPAASQLFVGWAEMMMEGLADGTIQALVQGDHELNFPPQCEALFPVFSVASRENAVSVECRAY